METVFFRSRRTFIIGGARSGKTALAERLARGCAGPRVYIATAEAHDAEMAERIARHRADRGDAFETLEAPRDLAGALARCDDAEATVVVDCLTLWLSNRLLDGDDLDAATAELCDALWTMRARVALVSNEVGLGLVPDTPLGRAFRDAQGRLNQRVAAVADAALLVVAGLPVTLKAPEPGA